MNTNGKRRVALVAVAVAVVFLFAASEVSAWGPVNRHHSGQGSVYIVQDWWRSRGYSNRGQTTRTFSSTSARYSAGDAVVVTVDEAKLMSGKKTLGIAKKEQKFVVTKVVGPWLGAKIEVDGKMISGWILDRQVSTESALSVSAKSADAAVAQPQSEVRSYSYKRAYRTNRRYRR